MPRVRILSADDVQALLDPAELRAALEAALIAQSNGLANVPPRIMAAAPNGLLAAMPGFLANGGDGLLATKLVCIYPDNVDAPSHQGLIAYFDAATGTPLALLDAEVITEERTAGVAAIAADLLARSDAHTLTIVGAGAQGRAHVRAFAPLRSWRTVRVGSRTRANAESLGAYAETVGMAGVTEIIGIDEFEDAVRSSAVVALATHSDVDVFDPSSVCAGAHISSVGSRAELPAALVSERNVVVVDHAGAVTSPPPAGAAEVQHATNAIEIGALVADPSRGRSDDSQITVYKSTGHAVQDIAAAHLVYTRAVERGVGTMVQL